MAVTKAIRAEDFVTAVEVARDKGLTVKAVYNAARAGRLQSIRFNGSVLITRSAAEAWEPAQDRKRRAVTAAKARWVATRERERQQESSLAS